jgi:hypothetical protein
VKILLIQAGLISTAFLAMALVPVAGRPVAVLSAGPLATVAEAGGEILAGSFSPSLVFATSERPDFVGRLYAAGASLVVKAPIGVGCQTSKILR